MPLLHDNNKGKNLHTKVFSPLVFKIADKTKALNLAGSYFFVAPGNVI